MRKGSHASLKLSVAHSLSANRCVPQCPTLFYRLIPRGCGTVFFLRGLCCGLTTCACLPRAVWVVRLFGKKKRRVRLTITVGGVLGLTSAPPDLFIRSRSTLVTADARIMVIL